MEKKMGSKINKTSYNLWRDWGGHFPECFSNEYQQSTQKWLGCQSS